MKPLKAAWLKLLKRKAVSVSPLLRGAREAVCHDPDRAVSHAHVSVAVLFDGISPAGYKLLIHFSKKALEGRRVRNSKTR